MYDSFAEVNIRVFYLTFIVNQGKIYDKKLVKTFKCGYRESRVAISGPSCVDTYFKTHGKNL